MLDKIGGRNTIKDIIRVTISNIIKLLAGILVGFILPKIIGVTDYGFYKTFTLYATYVGMFHFGISDGIYLVYGGKDYEELEKTKFRFYSKVFIGVEVVVAAFLAAIAVFSLNGEYKYIFISLAIYLIVNNITGYFQSISQITSRFAELSNRNIIQSCLISGSVLVLWGVHVYTKKLLSYRCYLYIYIGIVMVLSFWYIWTYRDLVFGKSNSSNDVREIGHFIKIGLPLMVSNLCSSLILTLDRQYVNLLFDTDTYAVYAFAYNMLALVTTATSAISTVIYPKLKKIDENHLEDTYESLNISIVILVFLCLIVYFPLTIFVTWFLPKYIDSLVIFRIVFPGLAISSAITIVMHNYYKAIGETLKYFIKSIVVLVVSGLANYVAYALFRTTISISVASIITMLFWYIYVDSFLSKKFHIKPYKCFVYLLIMISGFYFISSIKHWFLGMIIYIVFFFVITFVFYKDRISSFIQRK